MNENIYSVKRGKDLNILPMECHFLNKNALSTVVGQQVSFDFDLPLDLRPP